MQECKRINVVHQYNSDEQKIYSTHIISINTITTIDNLRWHKMYMQSCTHTCTCTCTVYQLCTCISAHENQTYLSIHYWFIQNYKK